MIFLAHEDQLRHPIVCSEEAFNIVNFSDFSVNVCRDTSADVDETEPVCEIVFLSGACMRQACSREPEE